MQNSRDSSALRQKTERRGQGNIRAYGASDITAAVRRPQNVQNGGKAIPMHPDKQKQKKKKRIVDFSIPQKFDFSFFLIVLILLTFGLIMLFSSKAIHLNWFTDLIRVSQ